MTRMQLINSPSTSFWLRDALLSSAKRDIVDALRDAETLTAVLQAELNAIQRPAYSVRRA